MVLVVDIGNTEIVVGVYKDDELKGYWRMSSKYPKTVDECWALLNVWFKLEEFSVDDIKAAVISSVVPSFSPVFKEIARNRLGVEPILISSRVDSGLKIKYDIPEAVGADRICNATAGYYKYGGPLIIVDLGTATTFDVISEQGEYTGGVIALGLKGASHELHRLSAKLPGVDLEFPGQVVGTNTEDSIQSGIMWGTISLIDGIVDKIIKEKGWKNVRVVATGGMASMLIEKSERINEISPMLTLEGMKIIFNRFSKNCS